MRAYITRLILKTHLLTSPLWLGQTIRRRKLALIPTLQMVDAARYNIISQDSQCVLLRD